MRYKLNPKYVGVAAGAVVAGLALTAVLVHPGKAPIAEDSKTVTVGSAYISKMLTYQGAIDYAQNVELRSEVNSSIEHVFVRYGQTVAQGEVLAALRSREFDVQIKRTQLEERQAKLWLDKSYDALVKSQRLAASLAAVESEKKISEAQSLVAASEKGVAAGILNPAEVATAKDALSAAEKSRDAAAVDNNVKLNSIENTRLENEKALVVLSSQISTNDQLKQKCTISAPFAGVVSAVSKKITEGGEQPVAAGEYLLTLTNVKEKVVKILVTKDALMDFALTKKFDCVARMNNRHVACEALSAQKSADELHYSLTLRLSESPGDALRPGDQVQVQMELSRRLADVAVPLASVKEKSSRLGVYVKKESGFEFTEIDVGMKGDEYVEVLRGLNAGDMILQ